MNFEARTENAVNANDAGWRGPVVGVLLRDGRRQMRIAGVIAMGAMAAMFALPLTAMAQFAPTPLGPTTLDPNAAPAGRDPNAPAQPLGERPARVQRSRPAETTVPPAPVNEAKIAQPIATFSGLDKITGRIISFDVAINETVQFGALQVTPRVCYARPQTVAPLTTAFIEVDEVTLDNKIRRIFTGWMFADSPGLHAVEHAVYDVWLTACKTSSPDIRPPASAAAPMPAPAPRRP